MTEACGDCKWWDGNGLVDKPGLCRISPPVPMITGGMPNKALWPETYAQDWCGQFVDKAGTPS